MLSAGQWLRSVGFGGDWPYVRSLLGILPNFAAAIAIPVVVLAVLVEAAPGLRGDRASRAFAGLVVLSLAALVAWEVVQRRSDRLVFDPYDLLASAAGSAVALCLFRWVSSGRPSSSP